MPDKKIPKAKCEKCKHCRLIDAYGYINCDVVENYHNIKRPKRCTDFKKRGVINAR